MGNDRTAIGQLLLPSKVVVMNLLAPGRGVVAGQGHGGPAFLTGFGVEAQPGEVLGLAGQLAHIFDQLGVALGSARARPPRAGVQKRAQVLPHGHAQLIFPSVILTIDILLTFNNGGGPK